MNREHLAQLKRPDLQTLAKRNNIRATQKNDVIIEELLKIPMPNIAGVAALERLMGPMALKKQKLMRRNGLCPKGPARDPVLAKVPAPKKERRQRCQKSKGAIQGEGEATQEDGASASTSGAASISTNAKAPDAADGGSGESGSGTAVTKREEASRSACQGTPTKSTRVFFPPVKHVAAKGSLRAERKLSMDGMEVKAYENGPAGSDDDRWEEVEVEAMTSLDNIVVDLGSSPVRPTRVRKENKKRRAEDDVCDSPRQAKRARNSRML